jgi:hypothetical protein
MASSTRQIVRRRSTNSSVTSKSSDTSSEKSCAATSSDSEPGEIVNTMLSKHPHGSNDASTIDDDDDIWFATPTSKTSQSRKKAPQKLTALKDVAPTKKPRRSKIPKEAGVSHTKQGTNTSKTPNNDTSVTESNPANDSSLTVDSNQLNGTAIPSSTTQLEENYDQVREFLNQLMARYIVPNFSVIKVRNEDIEELDYFIDYYWDPDDSRGEEVVYINKLLRSCASALKEQRGKSIFRKSEYTLPEGSDEHTPEIGMEVGRLYNGYSSHISLNYLNFHEYLSPQLGKLYRKDENYFVKWEPYDGIECVDKICGIDLVDEIDLYCKLYEHYEVDTPEYTSNTPFIAVGDNNTSSLFDDFNSACAPSDQQLPHKPPSTADTAGNNSTGAPSDQHWTNNPSSTADAASNNPTGAPSSQQPSHHLSSTADTAGNNSPGAPSDQHRTNNLPSTVDTEGNNSTGAPSSQQPSHNPPSTVDTAGTNSASIHPRNLAQPVVIQETLRQDNLTGSDSANNIVQVTNWLCIGFTPLYDRDFQRLNQFIDQSSGSVVVTTANSQRKCTWFRL